MQRAGELLATQAVSSEPRFSRIQTEHKGLTTEDLIALSKAKAERYNASKGSLTDYDCQLCGNKGNVAKVYYDERYDMVREGFTECKCMKIRGAIWKMKASGLEQAIATQRFENYTVEHEWQEAMKKTAMDYAKDPSGWLFLGGQVGCGKTHLCTAVCRDLLRAGKAVIYMPWQSEIVRLKACVMDSDEYTKQINEFKNAEVLYIDDFFKPVAGQEATAADVRIAYELINHRYLSKMLTLISSERNITELANIDEAVGSRIYEMSKGHYQSIKRDASRNYRFRGVSEV